MEQTKTALTTLEQAILKLETAIYTTKKTQAQLSEQVIELKKVINETYQQLNALIERFQKEGD
ncbi:MAG: hypothetical protein IJV07_05750 [Alphaproteobacteria bacterium]|nr:hypothetical protein [Alphaproteobacteria bacterium]